MSRKVLFVLFTDDFCRSFHAFIWALDLKQHGHEVSIILEGPGTKHLSLLEPSSASSGLAEKFREVKAAGLLHGACKAASAGCGMGSTCGGPEPADLHGLARTYGVQLLEDVSGHANITPFIEQGYQVVTF
ncbi:hypothetical protein PAPYR_2532 [Paratrimastix pyriformis]|uniref:Uncharacterized protein n=1 Tax=Paratrimastix pyriformis TaxID=342808 RepID=A0ABQ8UTM7_9EUKA|nr:hypothetical protein PAPYR_2532 [Paratrimastix pyriformis]|eukprot:GAFH01006350.1.p2 GENE.GAFH01006350.1~~GAFH01006350.1.p2  ORF type:complete len:131 (+),score=22.70 GAFH01006350.1:30-422(+)